MTIPYRKAERVGEKVTGIIPVLDAQYGNVWTNIPKALFNELKPELGQNFRVRFTARTGSSARASAYRRTFGELAKGAAMLCEQPAQYGRGAQPRQFRAENASAPARNGRLRSAASDDPVSTTLLSEIY